MHGHMAGLEVALLSFTDKKRRGDVADVEGNAISQKRRRNMVICHYDFPDACLSATVHVRLTVQPGRSTLRLSKSR